MPDNIKSGVQYQATDEDLPASLFGFVPVETKRKDPAQRESWFHSPDFDARYRRGRARQRLFFKRQRNKTRQTLETVGEPDDFQPSIVLARKEYFNPANDKKRRSRGDPRLALPAGGGDLQMLADTFGATSQRLTQGEELARHGLRLKGKRLILCGLIGHRLDCTRHANHRFFQLYRCRIRYCGVCGPQWFREKYSTLLVDLEPLVAHLLHNGRQHGKPMVFAKLDFTVPKTDEMPSRHFVRKFHADLRRFWRAVERRFGISRNEYGHAGCDEFGGNNTNLHRHCIYVGPKLPQSKRRKLPNGTWLLPELTALWSEIRGERSFVSIKSARSLAGALAHSLKYPAKFLEKSTPERLAELEVAFHRTRRFSTGGAFYRLKHVREPGEDSPIGECPLCGARLCEVLEPWVSCFQLEGEHRRDVNRVRSEVARARVLSGAGPPWGTT